jgi:hypothetical protein
MSKVGFVRLSPVAKLPFASVLRRDNNGAHQRLNPEGLQAWCKVGSMQKPTTLQHDARAFFQLGFMSGSNPQNHNAGTADPGCHHDDALTFMLD